MEKQFLCCLYKTGVISASISSWYLFCLLLEQWILLTALIAWRLLPDGDLFHTATSIPNWTTGWFIQWMSPSSCQSLLYHQQNITEIIRLTVCTCQKNLWRQREGERERERVFVLKFSDLTCVCWFMSLHMRLNSESRKKNTNIYISINTLGVVTRLNSFKNTAWTPEKYRKIPSRSLTARRKMMELEERILSRGNPDELGTQVPPRCWDQRSVDSVACSPGEAMGKKTFYIILILCISIFTVYTDVFTLLFLDYTCVYVYVYIIIYIPYIYLL